MIIRILGSIGILLIGVCISTAAFAKLDCTTTFKGRALYFCYDPNTGNCTRGLNDTSDPASADPFCYHRYGSHVESHGACGSSSVSVLFSKALAKAKKICKGFTLNSQKKFHTEHIRRFKVEKEKPKNDVDKATKKAQCNQSRLRTERAKYVRLKRLWTLKSRSKLLLLRRQLRALSEILTKENARNDAISAKIESIKQKWEVVCAQVCTQTGTDGNRPHFGCYSVEAHQRCNWAINQAEAEYLPLIASKRETLNMEYKKSKIKYQIWELSNPDFDGGLSSRLKEIEILQAICKK